MSKKLNKLSNHATIWSINAHTILHFSIITKYTCTCRLYRALSNHSTAILWQKKVHVSDESDLFLVNEQNVCGMYIDISAISWCSVILAPSLRNSPLRSPPPCLLLNSDKSGLVLTLSLRNSPPALPPPPPMSFTQQWQVGTGVNPRGGWGGCIPPTFLGGGDGLYKHPPPPLFEDKITLNLTFIVEKTDLFNCKTIKNSKNRSLAPLACTQMYSETRSLRFCQ